MNKSVFVSYIIGLVLASAMLVGCGGGSSRKMELPATGKPYEIVVLTSKDVWNSEAGDTLRHYFGRDIEWLNQPEPLYDLLLATPQTVSAPTLRHRNILSLEVSSSKYPVNHLTAQFDAKAKEQVRINIESPSIDSLTQYIVENHATLIALLDKAERDRMVRKGKDFRDEKLAEKIKSQFGFTMNIPKGYRVRNSSDDFLWISYELPLASQGIVIYSFDAMPSMSTAAIIAMRDEAVAKVPGPSDGSYMTTEMMIYPESKSVTINGTKWAETRGFWRVENDFMGGPFVNYVTYDPVTQKMIGIDLYVNSPDPKYGKRNYIKQLESMIMSVKFDAKGLNN